MKKTLIYILILIFFILIGISSYLVFKKVYNSHRPSEVEDNIIDEDNEDNIEEDNVINSNDSNIVKYIKNLINSNYDYEIVIKSNEYTLKYNGTRYDNIDNGIRSSYPNIENLKNINYQIEGNFIYDSLTKKEIFNPYFEADNRYIFLEDIINKIQDDNCKYESNEIICENKDEIITFEIENNLVTNINIDVKGEAYFYNYQHKYTNINNTKVISSFNKYFKITSIDTDIKDAVDGEYLLYNIDAITIQIKMEEISLGIFPIEKLIKYATFSKEYNNSIIKYIFDDEYVLFVDRINNLNIFSKNIYSNEILKLLNTNIEE